MNRLLIIAVAALTVASCAQTSSVLRCNYGSADISTTADEHCMLAGFAARKNLSDGVHIPLRTYCLSITDGADTVCIISNDLMEISPELSGAIRDSISMLSGLAKDHILLHCIHTHSAPRLGGASAVPGGSNYTYKCRCVRAIIDNAVNIIKGDTYQNFTLEAASGCTDINNNRCEKDGPRDSALYAVRFIDKSGKPICAAINLACHPVCMGYKSLLLSSDYSGVARRGIKERWGCEVFQLSGAQGNMDPKGGCQMVEHAEEIGSQLESELEALSFSKVNEKGLLKFSTAVASLPYLIDEITPEAVRAHADSLVEASTNFPRFADDVRGWEEEILSRFDKGPIKNTLDFNMSALNIDGVLFFFTQGEPFCEYQMEARETFAGNKLFFAGYTNGQNSYLPSEHAYEVRKGYEYEIEQMHVYIKAPYPLSPSMPSVYKSAVANTIWSVLL